MKRLAALVLCICSVFALFGCSVLQPKEYIGVYISRFTYKTVDYMGGATATYIIDFEENVVKLNRYFPYAEEESDETVIKEFTHEEEVTLINKLYSNGLFSIDEYYPQPDGIIDGGGWDMLIEYEDGTVKKSGGSNNGPDDVFKNCALAFYDLCGRGIVAYVPYEYYSPPMVERYIENDNTSKSLKMAAAKYEWNNHFFDADVFTLNEAEDLKSFKFSKGDILVLSTINYGRNSSYKKFYKCTVKSYDYTEELTNEATVYKSIWFRHAEIELEANKIYVLRLDFLNGDFVEYTFNTKV